MCFDNRLGKEESKSWFLLSVIRWVQLSGLEMVICQGPTTYQKPCEALDVYGLI